MSPVFHKIWKTGKITAYLRCKPSDFGHEHSENYLKLFLLKIMFTIHLLFSIEVRPKTTPTKMTLHFGDLPPGTLAIRFVPRI